MSKLKTYCKSGEHPVVVDQLTGKPKPCMACFNNDKPILGEKYKHDPKAR